MSMQNTQHAAFSLGMDKYQEDDWVGAFKEWLPLAEQGYAPAQHRIGMLYAYGQGVAQDYHLALTWLIQAVQQGHEDALASLPLIPMLLKKEKGEHVAQVAQQTYDELEKIATTAQEKNDLKILEWFVKSIQNVPFGEQKTLYALLVNDPHPDELLPKIQALENLVNNAQQTLAQLQGQTTTTWGDATQAMRDGIAEMAYTLAMLFAEGTGVARDHIKSLNYYTQAANHCHIEAQNTLGVLYASGHNGVPQDYNQALLWFTQAAQQGHVDARHTLGAMYIKGLGTRHNPRQLWEWLSEIAQQDDDAQAQYLLGVLCEGRHDLPQDEAQAVKWYTHAAQQGHVEARFILGTRYIRGQSTAHPPTQIWEWLCDIAQQGHSGAQYLLGVLYENGGDLPKNDALAMEWYAQAAQQGLANAQFCLGMMYYSGRGTQQDLAEAVQWCIHAALQGHADAQFELAKMYFKGTGVPQDITIASKWLSKAAMQGQKPAQEMSEKLSVYSNMQTIH